MKDGKWWFAENLRFDSEDSWCYKNKLYLGKVYGRLYTFESAKKSCPIGWHLPSNTEWKKLMDSYGGLSESYLDEVGGKAAYSTLIEDGPSRFNALLGGIGYIYNQKYRFLEHMGVYWSSTPSSSYAFIKSKSEEGGTCSGGSRSLQSPSDIYSVRYIQD